MTVQLSRDTIKKLTHESSEIRLRTLDQVEAKLLRALAHNESVEFCAGELCKQLIRWFGHHPLQASVKVLQLMLHVLGSNYRSDAVQYLGVKRFQHEMGKVQMLLKGRSEEQKLIQHIKTLLQEYANECELENQLTEGFANLNLQTDSENSDAQSTAGTAVFSELYNGAEDCEIAWSKPVIADYNAMKSLAETLSDTAATDKELSAVLEHLHITMCDYPAEFILQSPHILLHLLQLCNNVSDAKFALEDVLAVLATFLSNLKSRLQERRNCLSYAVMPVDTARRHKVQLKVSKALQLIMEMLLNQLQSNLYDCCNETILLLQLLYNILSVYAQQQLLVPREQMLKLSCIAQILWQSCQDMEHFTLQRIKQLIVNLLLLEMGENNARQAPLTDVSLLEPLLQDFVFQQNFPARHKRLCNLLFKADNSLEKKYAPLQQYDQALQLCVDILKDCSTNSAHIIEQSHMFTPMLEQLKSFKLLQRLFSAIIDCNAQFIVNATLRAQAEELLLDLLQSSHEPMQVYMFNKLAQAMKKQMACLMNAESYCPGVSNVKLLEAQIIGVPLSSSLLLLLLQEGQNNSNAAIKQHCEELLVMLLKAQHLLGSNWQQLLQLLDPILPLLQCCNYSEPLMQLLLKLYDPDVDNLSCLSIFKGNIGFLFHADNQLRSEALARIFYIMNAVPYGQNCLPNLQQIRDLIANDVCLLQVPRNIKNIFDKPIEERPSDEMSLAMHNLLCLLDSTDVEPLMRKTTLMQLNLMCQSWQLTGVLCEKGGFYLILKALESALEQESESDYTDAVIPAISILCKVLFYDTEVRCQLAQLANIYILLLRALFLFPHDLQLRQDACLCLFLLLYASYLVATAGTVQVPNLLQNLRLPLICEFNMHLLPNSRNKDNFNLKNVFSNSMAQQLYVRQMLASKCCSQFAQINHKFLETQSKFDFATDLMLTQRDLHLIKASTPAMNLKRFLKTINNATEHQMLITALITLKLQLLMQQFEPFIEQTHAQQLFRVLNKYLQLPPGSQHDFLLYEHLLEVWSLCIQLHLEHITLGIARILQADFQNTLIVLLQQLRTPMRFYAKLCELLQQLLQQQSQCFEQTAVDASIFYSNLLDLLERIGKQLLAERHILRERCVLSLQQQLSSRQLQLPDNTLMLYCKRALNFSRTIKSLIQTGAQWQRDCLLLLLQLQQQMENAAANFWLNGKALKYVSSLCSHNDAQVRALAWCVLIEISKCHNEQLVGTAHLLNELSFFTGGFLACCLSTFLDDYELLLVRQFAGKLFIELMQDFDCALQLLQQHTFLCSASNSLSNCMLQPTLPINFDFETTGALVSCEIISIFCCICSKLLQLNADYVEELCQSDFLLKLYELIKLPAAAAPAYYGMCADICQLYGRCYARKFDFLQRLLCRDQIWLHSFCQLLQTPSNMTHAALHNVLQLLLLLLKDDAAYAQLCMHFSKQPNNVLNCLLSCFSLNLLHTPLQRSALAVLSMLLIKSQMPAAAEENEEQEEHKTFAPILSQVIVAADNQQTEAAASELLFMELQRIFNSNHSNYKFDAAPNSNQTQIAETLALLLKLCPIAHTTARNLKLLEQILQILHEFFNHFKFNCTSTFVQRHGEKKKMAIIRNFHLYYSLLFHWYCSPAAVICDELQAVQLSKLLIQTWPWLAYHAELKLQILKLCAVLSERSILICQQFSTLISNCAHSLLQLVSKIVIDETHKLRAAKTDNVCIIETGIRVLINCCAAAEGRFALLRCHILDVFDGLNPFNPKCAKIKLEILELWLQFWEVFTRYTECAQACNLNPLCKFINNLKQYSSSRLLCLKILRNMCFQSTNRTILLTSNDFIYTMNEVMCATLSLPAANIKSYEEQMHVSVGIWKLISAGAKYVAMLRGTKLISQLHKLRQQLQCLQDADDVNFKSLSFALDLTVVLDIIFNIINEL